MRNYTKNHSVMLILLSHYKSHIIAIQILTIFVYNTNSHLPDTNSHHIFLLILQQQSLHQIFVVLPWCIKNTVSDPCWSLIKNVVLYFAYFLPLHLPPLSLAPYAFSFSPSYIVPLSITHFFIIISSDLITYFSAISAIHFASLTASTSWNIVVHVYLSLSCCTLQVW